MVGMKNNMGSKNRSMRSSAGRLTHHFTLSHKQPQQGPLQDYPSLQLTVRFETAAHTNTKLGFLPEKKFNYLISRTACKADSEGS